MLAHNLAEVVIRSLNESMFQRILLGKEFAKYKINELFVSINLELIH